MLRSVVPLTSPTERSTSRLNLDANIETIAATGAEAAVMLQNALNLSISQQVLETATVQNEDVPVWAATSLTVMADHDIHLSANESLTRAQLAEVLYQASILSLNAPGTAVFRMQN